MNASRFVPRSAAICRILNPYIVSPFSIWCSLMLRNTAEMGWYKTHVARYEISGRPIIQKWVKLQLDGCLWKIIYWQCWYISENRRNYVLERQLSIEKNTTRKKHQCIALTIYATCHFNHIWTHHLRSTNNVFEVSQWTQHFSFLRCTRDEITLQSCYNTTNFVSQLSLSGRGT